MNASSIPLRIQRDTDAQEEFDALLTKLVTHIYDRFDVDRVAHRELYARCVRELYAQFDNLGRDHITNYIYAGVSNGSIWWDDSSYPRLYITYPSTDCKYMRSIVSLTAAVVLFPRRVLIEEPLCALYLSVRWHWELRNYVKVRGALAQRTCSRRALRLQMCSFVHVQRPIVIGALPRAFVFGYLDAMMLRFDACAKSFSRELTMFPAAVAYIIARYTLHAPVTGYGNAGGPMKIWYEEHNIEVSPAVPHSVLATAGYCIENGIDLRWTNMCRGHDTCSERMCARHHCAQHINMLESQHVIVWARTHYHRYLRGIFRLASLPAPVKMRVKVG